MQQLLRWWNKWTIDGWGDIKIQGITFELSILAKNSFSKIPRQSINYSLSVTLQGERTKLNVTYFSTPWNRITTNISLFSIELAPFPDVSYKFLLRIFPKENITLLVSFCNFNRARDKILRFKPSIIIIMGMCKGETAPGRLYYQVSEPKKVITNVFSILFSFRN